MWRICFTTFVFGMSAFASQLAHADEPKTPAPVSGRSVTVEEILPADVLARVQLLRDELELIRFEMGKPENQQSEISVTNAAPREVFFQGITLFRKTNRLSFELTRTGGEEPENPPVAILRPYHVWIVVDRALKRVLIVKRRLGIRDKCEEKAQLESTTPTQVFRSVVQANRQLNLLLEKRFTPSDVFQQVTLAMNYGASLLARFPGATRIPKEPAFVRGKRPDDVFERLIECYELVRNIAQRSGVKMLEFKIDKATIKGKTPSDVNDVASLIVSELAYLHTLLDNAEAPARVYYPGRKLPSHVFQRAGMLKAQLEELKRRMEKQPD